jgi:hypothetical protein
MKRAKSKNTELTMQHLRDTSPGLYIVATWAKGYYRRDCLLIHPYSVRADKLSLAESVYGASLLVHPLDPSEFPSTDMLDPIFSLVSSPFYPILLELICAHACLIYKIAEEHGVFRSNSIKLAKQVVQTRFADMSATEIAGMLGTLLNSPPGDPNNFLALPTGSASLNSQLDWAPGMVFTKLLFIIMPLTSFF